MKFTEEQLAILRRIDSGEGRDLPPVEEQLHDIESKLDKRFDGGEVGKIVSKMIADSLSGESKKLAKLTKRVKKRK